MNRFISCIVDTNILIQFEEGDPNTGLLRYEFAKVFELCNKYGVSLYRHPLSDDDIKRDKNTIRRQKTLAYIQKYPVLDRPLLGNNEELIKLFGTILKDNDRVDCQILYSLLNDCVDFLITEDAGIHKRGAHNGSSLKDRIFSIQQFRAWLIKTFEPQSVFVPDVKELNVYSLDHFDPIFNSLREAYGDNDFKKWLAKCRVQKRKAWVIYQEDKIVGLCIYNLDNEYSERIDELGKKALKLCTFKISEEFRGQKYGELLLKTAIMYAAKNQISSIWLTAFSSDQEVLINFLDDFGFIDSNVLNERGENVFYKPFNPSEKFSALSPLSYHKRFAPLFLDGEDVEKYIIPIKPEYHELLFPEISTADGSQQLTFFENAKDYKIPGYTIKKVYLCHSPTNNLKEGSLVFFYRSHDQKEITTIGVVEKTKRTTDFNELVRMVGKRSVFSIEELNKHVETEVMVIEFRFARHLEKYPQFKHLLTLDILRAGPNSIINLDSDRYKKLKEIIK